MWTLATTFVALCGLALALAVGALRGRPLPGGSCRESWLAAHGLPRCQGCPRRRAGPRAPRGA